MVCTIACMRFTSAFRIAKRVCGPLCASMNGVEAMHVRRRGPGVESLSSQLTGAVTRIRSLFVGAGLRGARFPHMNATREDRERAHYLAGLLASCATHPAVIHVPLLVDGCEFVHRATALCAGDRHRFFHRAIEAIAAFAHQPAVRNGHAYGSLLILVRRCRYQPHAVALSTRREQ
jgi:hypothetical protein